MQLDGLVHQGQSLVLVPELGLDGREVVQERGEARVVRIERSGDDLVGTAVAVAGALRVTAPQVHPRQRSDDGRGSRMLRPPVGLRGRRRLLEHLDDPLVGTTLHARSVCKMLRDLDPHRLQSRRTGAFAVQRGFESRARARIVAPGQVDPRQRELEAGTNLAVATRAPDQRFGGSSPAFGSRRIGEAATQMLDELHRGVHRRCIVASIDREPVSFGQPLECGLVLTDLALARPVGNQRATERGRIAESARSTHEGFRPVRLDRAHSRIERGFDGRELELDRVDLGTVLPVGRRWEGPLQKLVVRTRRDVGQRQDGIGGIADDAVIGSHEQLGERVDPQPCSSQATHPQIVALGGLLAMHVRRLTAVTVGLPPAVGVVVELPRDDASGRV